VVGVRGHQPGLVEINVTGLDADDLFMIKKYGRWSFAELFPVNNREHRMAITSTSYCSHAVRSRPPQIGADANRNCWMRNRNDSLSWVAFGPTAHSAKRRARAPAHGERVKP
jgi:hypothetical protein